MDNKPVVQICRGMDGAVADIEIEKINSVHWDDTTGGYQSNLGHYEMFGYIPYDTAVKLVDCSGTHANIAKNAKVRICKPEPKKNPADKKYVEGYNILLSQAGQKPKSIIAQNRPTGEPPCTKKILQLLSDGPMHREILRKKLYKIGYKKQTVLNAIRALSNTIGDGRIICIGSSYSPKQVLCLPEDEELATNNIRNKKQDESIPHQEDEGLDSVRNDALEEAYKKGLLEGKEILQSLISSGHFNGSLETR